MQYQVYGPYYYHDGTAQIFDLFPIQYSISHVHFTLVLY